MPAVNHRPSPTSRLLAGLAVTLSTVAVYAGYTITQLQGLEEIQSTTIDRNRTDAFVYLVTSLLRRNLLDKAEAEMVGGAHLDQTPDYQLLSAQIHHLKNANKEAEAACRRVVIGRRPVPHGSGFR